MDVWIVVGRWVVVGWLCGWMSVGGLSLSGCIYGSVDRCVVVG